MRLMFWRDSGGQPTPEAQAALDEAKKIRQKADKVYATRAQLLERNHFAERIRLSYEGH